MQVIVRRARNGAVGGGSMFAWGSVAASRDTASFELPGRIERAQKGKARKYDVLRLPRQRETCAFRPPGACIAALKSSPQRARWRVLACGLFGDKDVRLMKRLAGRVVALACAGTGMEIRNAQNAVQLRYHCFFVAGYLWCPDTEPAT